MFFWWSLFRNIQTLIALLEVFFLCFVKFINLTLQNWGLFLDRSSVGFGKILVIFLYFGMALHPWYFFYLPPLFSLLLKPFQHFLLILIMINLILFQNILCNLNILFPIRVPDSKSLSIVLILDATFFQLVLNFSRFHLHLLIKDFSLNFVINAFLVELYFLSLREIYAG